MSFKVLIRSIRGQPPDNVWNIELRRLWKMVQLTIPSLLAAIITLWASPSQTLEAILEWAFTCGGDSGKRYTVCSIYACGQASQDKTLHQSPATTWLSHFLFVCPWHLVSKSIGFTGWACSFSFGVRLDSKKEHVVDVDRWCRVPSIGINSLLPIWA